MAAGGFMDKSELSQRSAGHRKRLRERYIEGGLDRFSDDEVIEFLLTLGTPRKDVKICARDARAVAAVKAAAHPQGR